MSRIETDVLVVGTGPAGATAAALLATYGVETLVVTKYGWTANTPRAHITNQGALEVFRTLGLEEAVMAQGTPNHLMGDTVFCTSLAGEELARLRTWGTHPTRRAEYELASPTVHCDIPQDLLEPILVGAAAARGARIRWNTEYLSLEQDEDGVLVRVRDRLTGEEHEVAARYVIGADGGRSQVAADIGLPMKGAMDVAGSMNIVFEADLSHLVARRPSVLYWVLQPGSDVGGIGMGLVRMVRPWHRWLIVWGYDIDQPPPEVDDAEATRIVRQLVGDPELAVTIESTSIWGNNHMSATRMSAGRVLCAGDACHRHPPSNGLGSNTSVQDAANLAWKLAHVLRGQAGPELLDTYSEERAPVAKQVPDRANRSIEEFGPIFGALGLLDAPDPEAAQAAMDARRQNTPRAREQRDALRAAIELKNYEFNAHGVELGQRYASAAVVPDGTPEPDPDPDQDPELHYRPTTRAGARLPHCWLERGTERISTKDLVPVGGWSLVTGIAGEAWVPAAERVAAELGIDLRATVVGPGREVRDVYDDWARLREVGEDGCVLVRPDGFVAWRSAGLVEDPAETLAAVLAGVLARPRPA